MNRFQEEQQAGQKGQGNNQDRNSPRSKPASQRVGAKGFAPPVYAWCAWPRRAEAPVCPMRAKAPFSSFGSSFRFFSPFWFLRRAKHKQCWDELRMVCAWRSARSARVEAAQWHIAANKHHWHHISIDTIFAACSLPGKKTQSREAAWHMANSDQSTGSCKKINRLIASVL